MLENYLIPIAPYALLAAVALVSLFGIVSQSIEIRKLKARIPKRQPADRPAAPRPSPSLPEEAPAFPRASLNLNRRSQVIRMSRRGQEVQTIASTLNLPRREVELLLKIHGMVLDNSSRNTTAS